eukprot:TRINITY_DN697_c1_g1_i2.p1 TRINITY_DN697_c1_g1~~TRINITY_DN697_c1_g1_i2.p1  ORF type:complete len:687 (-),score=161.08 TRINITY_DN697_c1_g1_i2:36-2096(-)
MKLYCLDDDGNSFLLYFNEVKILFDCGWNANDLLNFLPIISKKKINENNENGEEVGSDEEEVYKMVDEGGEGEELIKKIGKEIFVNSKILYKIPNWDFIINELSSIDIILISNYNRMFNLPFLFQQRNFQNFKGVIYATEPTIQIASIIIKEHINQVNNHMNNINDSREWIFSPFTSHVVEKESGNRWKKLYTLHHFQSVLSMIKPLSYNEVTKTYGSLSIQAVSSGYCLGSSHFVITSPESNEKIVFLSDGSGVVRYPLPMKSTKLHNADILIASHLSNHQLTNSITISNNNSDVNSSSSPEVRLHEALAHIGLTITNGGNVIIPIYPSGLIYELFEHIYNYLSSQKINNIPLFFISSVANHSLAYSDIIAEWLCPKKQEKVNKPEPPFYHEKMMSENQLYFFDNITDLIHDPNFREPCVIFSGHPSLRMGDIVHLINIYSSNPNNTLLCLEPDYLDYNKLLLPYQPIQMKVVYCPIDWRLKNTEFNTLLKEIKPKQIIIPKKYSKQIQSNNNNNSNGSISNLNYEKIQLNDGNISIFKALNILSFKVSNDFVIAKLSPSLSKQLTLKKIENIQFSNVNAFLSIRDHDFKLNEIDSNKQHHQQFQLLKQNYLCGTITSSNIIESLINRGIDVSDVTETNDQCIIHIKNLNCKIYLNESKTIVDVDNDEVRLLIKNIILENCKQLV